MCIQTTHLYLCTCTETLLPIPCSSHISSILSNSNNTTNQTSASTSTSTNINPPLCNGHRGITPLLLDIDEECQSHRQMRMEVWIAEEEARHDLDNSFGLNLDHDLDLDLGLDLEMLLDPQALPVVEEPEVLRTGEDENEGIKGNGKGGRGSDACVE